MRSLTYGALPQAAELDHMPRLSFENEAANDADHAHTPTHTVTARARCSGCPTSALLTTTRRGKWPELPAGWSWCGETTDGEPLLWCGLCTYQRRYDRLERTR